MAISSIPEVLKNGKVVYYSENRKDRKTDSAVVAAPVILNNIDEESNGEYLVGVSVKVSETNNSLELYEVYCIKKGLQSSLGTTSFDDTSSSRGELSNPSVLSILHDIANNKGGKSKKTGFS